MDDEELLGIKKKKVLNKSNLLLELQQLAKIAEHAKKTKDAEMKNKSTPHTKTAEAEKKATIAGHKDKIERFKKELDEWENMYQISVGDPVQMYQISVGDPVQMSPVKYITIPGHGPCEFTPESMQRMIKNEEVRHKATTELLDRTCADFNAKKEELRKAKIEIDNLQKQMQSLITTLNSVGMNQQQH